MHPILVSIGWFKIYAFGFMLALSFLFAIYFSSYRAKKFGLDPQFILDLSVYVILSGVIGARLLYVAFHLHEYDSLVDVFALWQGGAILFGGFLLAVFVSYVFAKKRNVDFMLVADVVAPSLAVGIMVTRLGCYLSGCCYGSPTSLPWGVVFPPASPAGAYQRSLGGGDGGPMPLHPAQLYDSLDGLLVVLVLLLWQRKLVKRGATFGAFLVLYGVLRFLVDFVRYYEESMKTFMDLTWNQVLSIVLVFLGSYLLIRKTDLQTKTPSGAAPAGSKTD
jgi:phosphatidylglycerol:prolipoprotein diacylglycerol transferase